MAWVIGQHGLLGSALVRALPAEAAVYRVPFRYHWGDPPALHEQLVRAVAGFALAVQGADDWTVHWAAGLGTMQSAAGAITTETAALHLVLSQLEAHRAFQLRPGRLTFASSAGAIYAGSRDFLISEKSDPAPTTEYAIAKLRQEKLVSEFSRHHPNVAVLAARFSTLYGGGQAAGKAQGLLSHLSRQVIRGLPMRIYVPLDTIRDYLEINDAARAMIAACEQVSTGSLLTKIIASERPTTISEIIAVFRKVASRPPRIITSMTSASELYGRRIQFRSSLRPDLRPEYRTSLLVGIAKLLEAERMRYATAT
ncbi:MAG: NAD(P)-dependent oxidoreductase [Dokdonella sp.]